MTLNIAKNIKKPLTYIASQLNASTATIDPIIYLFTIVIHYKF